MDAYVEYYPSAISTGTVAGINWHAKYCLATAVNIILMVGMAAVSSIIVCAGMPACCEYGFSQSGMSEAVLAHRPL